MPLLTPDPVSFFMQDIGAPSLLTAEEEQALGRRVQAGLQAQQQLRSSAASPEQRRRLEEQAADGRAAEDQLCRAFARLVFSQTRRYQQLGVPLADLIQEGNIGLLQAARRFDPANGARFSTYAVHWIRQALYAALRDRQDSLSLPAQVRASLNALRRAEDELRQQLGCEPDSEQLAAALKLPPEKVEELRNWAQSLLSLDRPVGDDEETPLVDFVADERLPSTADLLSENRQLQDLSDWLERLPADEAKVLTLRFGLEAGAEPCSLSEAGRLLGISRDAVNRIERAALRRLRGFARTAPSIATA